MFSDLGKLIINTQKKYDQICDLWDAVANKKDIKSVNLKKKYVSDAENDKIIINSIDEYRAILNTQSVYLMLYLGSVNYKNSIVTSRVKAQNSILQKIHTYCLTHENGKIPLNKCINDLFGIRIIINAVFGYDDVKTYISKYFPKYKCINSSKELYNATHVYFKSDNYHFQWELQIWSKQDEETNLHSHSLYKQDYVKWEKEQGGVVID